MLRRSARSSQRVATRPASLLSLVAAVALLLSACSSGNSTSQSASASASTSVSTSTAPSASAPVKRSGTITWAISHAVPQAADAPRFIAKEKLEDMGYEVKFLYLEKSDDPPQAVARGDAQFGLASASSAFAASSSGIPIVSVMTHSHPDYVLVAPTNVDGIEGLDGLRFGIHAEVSTTNLLLQVALDGHPDVKPDVLVVPGSANRIQAMAAGQLDASAIQLGDVAKLEELAPGKFHVIYDFAKEAPNIYDQMLFVSKDTLATKKQLVEDVIAASLAAVKEAYANVDEVADIMAKNIPKTTAEQAKQLAKVYTDSKVWLEDGGMKTEGLNATIDALSKAGLLKTKPSVENCCDASVLQTVLSSQ